MLVLRIGALIAALVAVITIPVVIINKVKKSKEPEMEIEFDFIDSEDTAWPDEEDSCTGSRSTER